MSEVKKENNPIEENPDLLDETTQHPAIRVFAKAMELYTGVKWLDENGKIAFAVTRNKVARALANPSETRSTKWPHLSLEKWDNIYRIISNLGSRTALGPYMIPFTDIKLPKIRHSSGIYNFETDEFLDYMEKLASNDAFWLKVPNKFRHMGPEGEQHSQRDALRSELIELINSCK